MTYFFCVGIFASSLPAMALNPEERLADPVLEERARIISAEIRCLVCQNQSIDDSDASLAQDLRIEIRRMLLQGKSIQEVKDSLQKTYGDYVLLSPPMNAETYLLWLSPIFIVLIGGFILWQQIRRKPFDVTSIPNNRTTTNAEIIEKTSPLVTIAMIGLVLCVSFVGYQYLGRPDLPSKPLGNRSEEIARQQINEQKTLHNAEQKMHSALRKAEDSPNNPKLWLEVAHQAQLAQQYQVELRAVTQMHRLSPNQAALFALEAEVLSRLADGQVTIPARELVAKALNLDSSEPRARLIAGIAAFQDQEYTSAIQIWQLLLTDSTPDAPWRDSVQQHIQQAIRQGGTPSNQEQVFSEDQQEMIVNMVNSLKSKLEDNPNDLKGWQRLVRSYEVLHQPKNLLNALFNVARLRPKHWLSQVAPLKNAFTQGQEEHFITQIGHTLERMQKIDPKHSEYLFYAGQYAKLNGDNKKAKALWKKLLNRLPEDAPIIETLQSQIDALSLT